ncbi:hypothetical protein Tco_1480202, partial [Tanacetum coccineum]
MSVRPVWRSKLNYCNISNKVDVNLPTPIPKPQYPLKEPSQLNTPTTHSNHVSLQSHSLPLSDSCDTNVGQASIPPQSVNQTQLTQPPFPYLLINPYVASMLHAQTPPSTQVIIEYLVNISKRRAFWSLNEDILKITILKTNMPYPSRKIRRIRACTHQRPQRNKAQYA